MPPELVTGLVLAGGRGTRMGGVDKGLQPYRGQPLALHALVRLAPQVGAMLISANRHLGAYEAFGAPVWPDARADFAGPLAGVLAGLSHCDTPWLATVPCDCPAFPADLVERLSSAQQAQRAEIAVARAGGRTQPVFMLIDATLAASLARFLDEGGHKVGQWIARHRTVEVDFPDEAAFANANTLDELRALEQPHA